MVVVALIGVLAAIAIPHWRRSVIQANSKSCINNLRVLADAKQQFALEAKKAQTDTCTLDDLTIFLRNPDATCCPANDSPYTLSGSGTIGDTVQCPNYNATDPEFSTHLLGFE